MKKITINLFILLLFAGFTNAQERERGDRREKIEERIEAKKIGFLTQHLDLSTSEAQQFWPIYNEYQAKLKSLKPENNDGERPNKDMTDAEANEMLSDMLDRESKSLDLKKEYIGKLKNVISPTKVAKLMIAERKFRAEVLAQLKKRMNKMDGKKRKNEKQEKKQKRLKE